MRWNVPSYRRISEPFNLVSNVRYVKIIDDVPRNVDNDSEASVLKFL